MLMVLVDTPILYYIVIAAVASRSLNNSNVKTIVILTRNLQYYSFCRVNVLNYNSVIDIKILFVIFKRFILKMHDNIMNLYNIINKMT